MYKWSWWYSSPLIWQIFLTTKWFQLFWIKSVPFLSWIILPLRKQLMLIPWFMPYKTFHFMCYLDFFTKAFRRLLFPAFVPIHCVFIHIFIREYESIYVYSYLPLRIFSRYVIKEKEVNSIIQYKQADFMVVLQKILPSKRIKNSCVNQSQI